MCREALVIFRARLQRVGPVPYAEPHMGRHTRRWICTQDLFDSEAARRRPERREKALGSSSFDGEASPRVRKALSPPMNSLPRHLMSEHA